MPTSQTFYFRIAFITIETIKIKTIAPINAGRIGTPPKTGPHVPNSLLPIAEPIKPAIIFRDK